MTKFGCVIADPPWKYGDQMLNMKSTGDGAAAKYACMSVEDICLLGRCPNDNGIPYLKGPLQIMGQEIADDAHLWLWVTNAFMEQGYRVVRAWGFEPKTIVTWVKGRLATDELKLAADGNLAPVLIQHIGQGHYLRNSTEHCIFAVRGRCPARVRNLPTAFIAPRGEHSKKPDTIHEWAELMSPGPYLELFARRRREGWTGVGNEL